MSFSRIEVHRFFARLFLSHFYSISQHLRLRACILRLNALQCSQVGQFQPSPQALCLRALSASLLLSDQEISHSIRLRRSRSADKACAEGAPRPRCSMCLPRLAPRISTQDIFFSDNISPSYLSLFTHPQTQPTS